MRSARSASSSTCGRAGARSRPAAAAAERYLGVARDLARESDWARDPDTSFEVLAQSAECGYSSRRYDDALAFLDDLARRPLSPLQHGRVAARRTSIYA